MTLLSSGEMLAASDVLGDVEPWWHVEVGDDDVATIVWTESMDFHVTTRGLRTLVDEQGEPLPRTAEVLQAELRRLLKVGDTLTVAASDQDEPALEVSVTLTVEPFTVERLATLAWPVIATLTNVFDPGTFGAEYVMGNVAHTIEEN